jgi:hypothetical protein
VSTRLSIVSTVEARTQHLPAVRSAEIWTRHPDGIGSRTSSRRRNYVSILVSIVASLMMVGMVAGAAVALERASEDACGMVDSPPCDAVQDEWCKAINGRMLCVGEPT